jgi:hypothetical protein
LDQALALIQINSGRAAVAVDGNRSPIRPVVISMRPFLFRCPTTGMNVQALARESEWKLDGYVAQHCVACGGVHLVKPATGKLLSDEIEKRPPRPRR